MLERNDHACRNRGTKDVRSKALFNELESIQKWLPVMKINSRQNPAYGPD
jgi:hypothetical protein